MSGRQILVGAAAAAILAGVGVSAAFAVGSGSQFKWLASTTPPRGSTTVSLPAGLGTLSVPPRFQPAKSDSGAYSAARLASDGSYLGFLNVTPQEGDESLQSWDTFRVDHLRDDDASSAHEDGKVSSVVSGSVVRSCVIDDYVTRVGGHHFREVACLVKTASQGAVVVAAVPANDPAHLWGDLRRSVASYRA